MSFFRRRPGLPLTGLFPVRVLLALVTSSAVTAGVAGPLAVQALDARSNQAAVAEARGRLGFSPDHQTNGAATVDARNPTTRTGEAVPTGAVPTKAVPTDAVPTNAVAPGAADPGASPPAGLPTADSPNAVNAPAEAGASPRPVPSGPITKPATDQPGSPTTAPTAATAGESGVMGTPVGNQAAVGAQPAVSTSSPVGSNARTDGSATAGSGAGPTTSTPQTLPILTVSLVSSRQKASYLDGALVWGRVHLAVRPPPGATEVRFWLDGATTGPPDRVDDSAPFTLVPEGEWLDAETLSEGSHVLRVVADVPVRGEVPAAATFAVRHAAGE